MTTKVVKRKNKSNIITSDAKSSPLENSIQAFFRMTKEDMDKQHHLTKTTLKILEQ